MKNILKLVIGFLFVFCLQMQVMAQDVTITVISDAHINSDKSENQMTPSIKKLLTAVKQTNSDTSNMVVFLGDNVQSASRVDICMFSKIIRKLKKPYFVVVGNRDVSKSRGVLTNEFYRIVNKFSSNKIDKLPCVKHEKGLVFVFLSGVNETFPTYKGYYKTNELNFLDETLTKYKDKNVIIFQHFPVVYPKDDETRQTVKPELYLNVLAKHNNVLAVVSGHYHYENVIEHNKIKHISVGSLAVNGEYEQIKILQGKNNARTITTKILSVE